MKVYIAGPMTGLPNCNYPAFHKAAAALRARGYDVLSPAEYKPTNGARNQGATRPQDTPWHVWLKRGLRLMLKCEAVFVLDGWEQSRGASLEVSMARELQMPVYKIDQAWVSNRRAEKLAKNGYGEPE